MKIFRMIFFTRHAESEGNPHGYFHDRTGFSLSEVCKRCAAALAHRQVQKQIKPEHLRVIIDELDHRSASG